MLERSQVWHLHKKNKNEMMISQGIGDTSEGTAVDRLIVSVTNEPTTSWIMLFAHKESGIITIKQRQLTPGKPVELADFTQDLDDLIDSPEEHSESLRNQLKDSETGDILLAYSWASDDSHRRYDMFPEATGADNTGDTNSEERQLHTIVGTDGNNQVFVILNCFMSSKAQWAFSWINIVVAPHLHPGTALSRTRNYRTDADPQQTRAIEGVSSG